VSDEGREEWEIYRYRVRCGRHAEATSGARNSHEMLEPQCQGWGGGAWANTWQIHGAHRQHGATHHRERGHAENGGAIDREAVEGLQCREPQMVYRVQVERLAGHQVAQPELERPRGVTRTDRDLAS